MQEEVIVYPSYYETHSRVLDEVEDWLEQRELIHYASSLIARGVRESELEIAVRRACAAIQAAQLEVNRHFRKIFLSCDEGICYDWKISDLGMRITLTVLGFRF